MSAGPVRVVVVGPPLAASGGIGRVMSYALAALDQNGTSVRSGNEVEVQVLDTRGRRRSPWWALLPLLSSCAVLLARALRRTVDVVHVNMSSHGSALRKGVVVRVCRLGGLPVVLHLHASSFPEFFEPLPTWAQSWVRRTFALASTVLVLSHSWADYVRDELGVPPERVAVLPNATPAGSRAPGRRSGEPLRVLMLGRLGPRKGTPELLAALGDPEMRARSWTATLAGDGDTADYRARAADLGLDARVSLPGWLNQPEVATLLSEAHVLVLPSHAEGLPMSVIEAFSAAVPVISTTVGGLREVVSHEENGLAVTPGDVAGLVAALVRLHDDEVLRARLADGALRTWQAGHSIDRYAHRLAATWLRAAGRTPASEPELSRRLPIGG
jgi:glycosyltransferase involved in cell wall biosynthesis